MDTLSNDSIIEILDYLDIMEIEALFRSNKGLYRASNDQYILKYISSRFNLPYVSSFRNLMLFVHMKWEDLYIFALDTDDKRLLEYFNSKYNNDIGYVILRAISLDRFDIVYTLYNEQGYVLPNDSDYILTYNTVKSILDNNNIDLLSDILLYNTDTIMTKLIVYTALNDGAYVSRYLYNNISHEDISELYNIAAKYDSNRALYSIYSTTNVKPEEKAVEIAVENNSLYFIDILIRSYGMYRLVIDTAVKLGKHDILNYIIDNNNYYNILHISALYYLSNIAYTAGKLTKSYMKAAVYYEDIILINKLLSLGAEIGDYDIENASKNGRYDIVKLLVEHKGNIGNAVHIAIRSKHYNIAEYLVNNGGSINNDDVTYVLSKYHYKFAKFLVEHGASVPKAALRYVNPYITSIYDYFSKNVTEP